MLERSRDIELTEVFVGMMMKFLSVFFIVLNRYLRKKFLHLYNRGREDQERFFPGWKVLKVCSKKYIKNNPFFFINLLHHCRCANIRVYTSVCSHFCHYSPLTIISHTPPSFIGKKRWPKVAIIIWHIYTVL